MSYGEDYYKKNTQDRDRPALWMYERIWKKYLGQGPVLDFGCGLGHFARRISQYQQTFGLETNPFAVEHMRRKVPTVKLISSIAELPDNSLGSITALHVLEHITDEELASIGKEFTRTLKPLGRLLVVMPDLLGRAHALKGKEWSAFSDPTHINLKGSSGWRTFFENNWDLNLISCFADGYYDFPYSKTFFRSLSGDAVRAAKTLVQFSLARPLLKSGDGENVIFILEKRNE